MTDNEREILIMTAAGDRNWPDHAFETTEDLIEQKLVHRDEVLLTDKGRDRLLVELSRELAKQAARIEELEAR